MNGFPCYSSTFVCHGGRYDLRKKWFDLKVNPIIVSINDKTLPPPIKNNFINYINGPTKVYYRCSHFSKYIINSNLYVRCDPMLWNRVVWSTNKDIIHAGVNIGVHYGVNLYLSKLGGGGVYVNDEEQIQEIYGPCEKKEYKAVQLQDIYSKWFERNLCLE